MDGDRPMVDGRDLLESRLQELVREAFEEGWEFGDEDLPDPSCCCYAETVEAYRKYDKKLHELLVSYFDSEASDVGAQDEASEAREVGDGVRPKPRLSGRDIQSTTSNRKERIMYRYLVVEYCFEDDSWRGEKRILGAYPDIKSARVDAGKYIKENVKKMKAKYRHWQVDVQKERMYFLIKGV